MIIVGYPGIGKTSLASWHNDYLDVDSSRFMFDGVRPKKWAFYYVKIAEDLSEQGYKVFTSSHKEVRDNLQNSTEIVLVICPSLDLKEEWIEKLKDRWIENPSHKNFRSWKRAEEHYAEDIKELINAQWPVIEIKDNHYELDELIDEWVNKLTSQEIQLLL